MRIKNISPWGDLDVPLLRRVVGAGEIVDVTEDQAARLLVQEENWQPTDKDAKAVLKRLEDGEPEPTPEGLQPGVTDPDISDEGTVPDEESDQR